MEYPESFEIIKEFYDPKTGEKYKVGRVVQLATSDGMYFSTNSKFDYESYTLSYNFITMLGSDYFREIKIEEVNVTTTDIIYDYLYRIGLLDGLGSIQRGNIKDRMRSIIES